MKQRFLVVLTLCFLAVITNAQEAPNVANSSPQSANAQTSDKLNNVPTNIFTGMPAIGVPIYSYSNNGLQLGVSLSYYAGGNQLLAGTPDLGLGWSLSGTSAITRTVRGVPDDLPNGFIYTPAMPLDYRTDANKYYYDSLDAQQDVFQFSVPGSSGSFYIGKDKQIVLTPMSKTKITYNGNNGAGIINNFTIVTEEGVRYEFNHTEAYQIANLTNTQSGYANTTYNAAWYLSYAVSPFNTDTIRYEYYMSGTTDTVSYPKTVVVRNSDGVTTSSYTPTGSVAKTTVRLYSILLPNKKKLSFVYAKAYPNATDSPLVQINISDTAFRYGYKLGYKLADTTFSTNGTALNWKNVRMMLETVTPYTLSELQKGYRFGYSLPRLSRLGEMTEEDANKRDHWGFNNGATANGTNTIPQVNGLPGGANRNPNINFAKASILDKFYLPDGGFTFYEYELNDHYPYIKDPEQLAIQANATTQNTITINQVFSSKHQLIFTCDNTLSRIGAAPFGGTGTLQCSIKSTDGLITYLTKNISLYELFYQGLKTWEFNLVNGTYLLVMQPISTSFTTAMPINVNWENKLPDVTTNANVTGGLRLKRISKILFDNPQMLTEEYRYVTEDGKSSGFLGDVPKYDYPYYTTAINGGTTITPYTVVNSEPVSNVNYAQGSPVGYSRVEVIKGTAANNLGKTVYEFTDLKDVNAASLTNLFPYAPIEMRSWGIGLPKKIMVYDKNDVLIKKTVSNYGFDSVFYVNTNHKSIKLGKSGTTFFGNPANSTTPKTATYTGQEYYPTNGRVYLISTTDTLYQTNGSINTSYSNYTYDTNYNIKTTVMAYDRNRNLQLEKRLYYPYDYTVGGAIGTLRTNGIIAPVIATEAWVIGDANPRLLSGTFTDFQTLPTGYIRPLTTYATENNSPIPQSVIGVFNPAQLNRNTTYFKPQQSFTLYDAKGNLLQTESPVTGRKAASMRDYDNQYTIANVSNAAYSDVAYTSFEADASGGWVVPTLGRVDTLSVTGKRSYNLNAGFIDRNNINTAIPMTLTFWAKSPSGVYVNMDLQNNPIASHNGWELFKVEFAAIASIHISGYGLIDELRLHPKNANMVTTTYKEGLGLATSSADANNTIIYSEYDNLNRLKLIRDKDKNIITKYAYEDVQIVNDTTAVNTTPNWVYSNWVCQGNNNGWLDSTFYDMNPNSPTYNQTQIHSGLNYCQCSNNPQYKTMPNGTCELGIKVITASVYTKVCDSNGCVWKWVCTYHYEWSDGSSSQNYTQYSTYSCPLGPGNS
jgi:hypothetical protein